MAVPSIGSTPLAGVLTTPWGPLSGEGSLFPFIHTHLPPQSQAADPRSERLKVKGTEREIIFSIWYSLYSDSHAIYTTKWTKRGVDVILKG